MSQTMTLREKIEADFKEAAKAKDETRLSTLRLVLASVKNREVEKRTKLSKTESSVEKLEELSKLSEEEITDVISGEVKKRKEAAQQYEKGQRPELAKKEEDEMKILSAYLPEQLDEEEIRKIVTETIKETGVSDIKEMGKLMGALMPKLKGRADGNLVSRIVKEQLS